MYYNLLGTLKRRLIYELQDVFTHHPVYEKVIPYIQSKNSFNERPPFGVIVKGAGGNRLPLSADNYLGRISSHTMLAYFDAPTFPIEWVREDLGAVAANDKVFPSAPGIYYLEVLEAPANATTPGTFIIDPLLTITQEFVRVFESGVEKGAKLARKPVKGTLRLYENAYFMLTEGEHYTVDYKTGDITFTTTFAPKAYVYAGYRTAAPSIGPKEFYWNSADTTTIPGVVIAFGKRARKGDKVAIVVYDDRRDTAEAYGGKFEVSFDLDIFAQDPTQAEEISDFLIMGLLMKQATLASEGIELIEMAPGGESDEPQDENADISSYTVPVSLQLRADWEIHVPLALTLSKAKAGGGSGGGGVQLVPTHLALSTLPVFADRNNDFERIG